MYETYLEDSATPEDKLAWMLCQIIDDDAPLRWTRYRFAAGCLLAPSNKLREILAEHEAAAEVMK